MGKDPVGVTPAGFCIEGKGSWFRASLWGVLPPLTGDESFA